KLSDFPSNRQLQAFLRPAVLFAKVGWLVLDRAEAHMVVQLVSLHTQHQDPYIQKETAEWASGHGDDVLATAILAGVRRSTNIAIGTQAKIGEMSLSVIT